MFPGVRAAEAKGETRGGIGGGEEIIRHTHALEGKIRGLRRDIARVKTIARERGAATAVVTEKK